MGARRIVRPAHGKRIFWANRGGTDSIQSAPRLANANAPQRHRLPHAARQLPAVGDAQLGEDPLGVLLDRAAGDAEDHADLPIRLVLQHPAHDLRLATG
jgi:hypothetical protein